MEIRFKEIVMLSSKKCYRLVCNHPFLVGFVCFLILLYKSCPFLFFLLFHASPVLVCTAVLLGTLLSFGPSSIQEIEYVERVSDEITPLKAGVFGNASAVAPREESFSVGRFTINKRELVELDSEVLSSDGIKASKVEEANGLVECEPLIDANTREIQFEKEEIEEAIKREVSGLELERRKEICGENLSVESVSRDEEISAENQHLGVQEVGTVIAKNQHLGGQEVGTDVEVADDEITRLSVRTLEGDHIDFSLKNDKCIDDDVSSDAESDDEESSSPDATMAEIIPMLNELHLLLDSEDLHSAGVSDDGSDAASEQSHKSDNEYEVSDEDSENEGHVADKDDADEDEEETHEGKDDESKSAIKWTEDDEKNLMDLGTSELERNQRLENLIARRRARNNLRMMAEKNLIDFSTVDLPFNVPSITATRNNPFDLPDNSYDNMGFLPIPGSAPSILLPRRNPFDLPYESNEEKPDLKGDSFHQEFLTFTQKDALFRRHESFSVGHSSLGPSKLGLQENNWKLHFMPEKLDSEEAVYPRNQTQQKVVDDLNLGSIPDVESISDVTENDIKFVEQKDDLEMEAIASPDHSSDRDDFRKGIHEDINAVDLKKVDERDLHDDVVKIIQRDVEKNDEMESSLSKLEATEIVLGRSADESQFERKSLEKNYSSNSSSLSSPETDERTFDEHGEEELATLELRDSQVEESNPLVEASCEESDIQLSREIIDVNPHKEPVYDSSPSAVTSEKFHSFSSTSSESQVEISNMCGSPVSDETKEPNIATESGFHTRSIPNDSSSSGDLCSPSSDGHVGDKNGQDSMEVSQLSDDKNGLLEPEFDIQHVSANSSASSLESGSVDGAIMPKEQITCIEEGSPMVEISQDFPLEVNQTEGFSLEEEEVVQYDMADLDSKVISTDSSHEHLSDEDKYLKPAANDGPLELGTTPDRLSFSNGSTSSSSESPEYELATNWPTSKEGTRDEIESEEQRHVSEQLDFLAEEYKSQFTEKRINVDVDEKEEIDEDLLSSVNVPEIAEIKDVGNSSHVEFITQEIEGESIYFDSVPKESIQTDTNLEVSPVLEARSMEHTDLDFKQIEGGSIDSDSVPKESVQTETNSEVPPILAAKSMEQTDLDFKQIEGGSIDSDSVPKESVETETNLEVPPVLEAKSTEQIDLDSKQLEGGSFDSDSVPKESVRTGTNLEVPPILEARSMEDTDLDSRQLEGRSINSDSVSKEYVQTETNIELPPVFEARLMEHTYLDSRQLEGGSIDSDSVPKEYVQTETNIELPPVLEVRLMEHTDLDSRQLEGGSIDSDSVPKEYVQTETNIELPPVFEARSMEHTDLDSRQLEGGSIDSDSVPKESIQSETNLKLPPVFEARSMEHTDLDSRQLEGGSIDSDSVPKESIQSETNLKLPPVLESKSMEYTNLDFNQLDNEIDDNEAISPSKVEPLAEEETEKPMNLSSDLDIVKVPEVSHVDPKQKSENADQLTKLSDVKD